MLKLYLLKIKNIRTILVPMLFTGLFFYDQCGFKNLVQFQVWTGECRDSGEEIDYTVTPGLSKEVCNYDKNVTQFNLGSLVFK